MEIVELAPELEHPFFIGSQFHPEVGAMPAAMSVSSQAISGPNQQWVGMPSVCLSHPSMHERGEPMRRSCCTLALTSRIQDERVLRRCILCRSTTSVQQPSGVNSLAGGRRLTGTACCAHSEVC